MDGFFSAVVADVGDPQGRGRCRLQIPQVSGNIVTGWAEPMAAGSARLGDRVYATFEGGDVNAPAFLPRLNSQADWQPLTLLAGWQNRGFGQDSPHYRLTGDGMLELNGAIMLTAAPTSVGSGTDIQFAQLPAGVRPTYSSYQLCSSDSAAPFLAKSKAAARTGAGTYASTTFGSNLAGESTPFTLQFYAPGSGSVIITVNAFMSASSTGNSAFMSALVTRDDTGATVLSPTIANSGGSSGTDHTSTGAIIPLDGLVPGGSHTLTAMYAASNAGVTASYDLRRIRVDPVEPYSAPMTRVLVTTSGGLYALFPLGSAGVAVHLAGYRTRAA